MEHAGRQRSVDFRLLEYVDKVFGSPGTARSHQRDAADVAHRLQLCDVIAAPHAITGHAIEHDLAGATFLHFAHPGQGVASGVARAVGVARVLEHLVTILDVGAVDADHHALRAEACRQFFDETGVCDGRRVDGDLFSAGIEHRFGILHRADAARDTEGDIQHAGDAGHPVAVHTAALGAGGDVVEHDLVRALVAIALGEHQDVAHDLVIAEANTLYVLAVADVEAGDDAFGKNGRNSEGLINSSNKALPLIAAAAPSAASAARSAAERTPPEACQAICG